MELLQTQDDSRYRTQRKTRRFSRRVQRSSRVYKGKKLAGHLGHERVTIQNLDIVKVDAENNLIAIKGGIPGPKGGIVLIRDSVKNV